MLEDTYSLDASQMIAIVSKSTWVDHRRGFVNTVNDSNKIKIIT